jgi:hypothetical protein
MVTNEECEERPKRAHTSGRMLRFPVRLERYSSKVKALIIGTPEHTALVAALRENFPEIYETR